MVHHIVMWKFKPEIEEERKADLKKDMEANLSSLIGKVPGLLSVSFVSEPFASSTHDMALVTTFEKSGRYQSVFCTSGACQSSGYICASVCDRACMSGLSGLEEKYRSGQCSDTFLKGIFQ